MLDRILVPTWPQHFVFHIAPEAHDEQVIDALALLDFERLVPGPENLLRAEPLLPVRDAVGRIPRLVEELREQLEPQQGAAHAEPRRLHVMGDMHEVSLTAREDPDAELEEELDRVERAHHVLQRCEGAGHAGRRAALILVCLPLEVAVEEFFPVGPSPGGPRSGLR